MLHECVFGEKTLRPTVYGKFALTWILYLNDYVLTIWNLNMVRPVLIKVYTRVTEVITWIYCLKPTFHFRKKSHKKSFQTEKNFVLFPPDISLQSVVEASSSPSPLEAKQKFRAKIMSWDTSFPFRWRDHFRHK